MNAKIFFALMIVASLTACHRAENKDDVSAAKVGGSNVSFAADSPQAAAIVTRPVAPRENETLRLHGRLVWDEDVTVHVFTPFGGRVSRIIAQDGQVVEKDSPLAIIASPEYGDAQSEAARAVLDLNLAEQTLKRLKEIAATGAVPQKELNAAEIEFTRAQGEARRKLERIALYGDGTNSVDMEFTLRSPLAGTVVKKNINPGQEVSRDQMTANAPPLFVITDPSRLWVVLDATEQDLPSLKPGTKIKMQSQTYPGRLFAARIEVVSDFVDPDSRTIKVRATVDNSQRLLKAEMFVSAELPALSQTGVDAPSPAVFLMGDKHYVFVENARGSYQRQEVTIGSEQVGHTLVTKGLQPGQNVVTDGGLLLNQILIENGSAVDRYVLP